MLGERHQDHWLIGKLALIAAVSLSIFQLWQPLAGFFPAGFLPFESILGLQPATYFRPIHLCWILCLGFLVYPLSNKVALLRWVDFASIVAVIWASARILNFDYRSIEHLLNGLSTEDFAAGLVVVVATLEMARRSVGVVMTVGGFSLSSLQRVWQCASGCTSNQGL